MTDTDHRFMQQALLEAQKAADSQDVPVGAVITHEERIIARAHNQVEQLRDPTAHAEMIAVTQAVSTIGQKWLHDCCLYVTLEPCCMCAGALVLARIRRIVFAAYDPKAGACGTVFNLAKGRPLNHAIEVYGGVMEDEGAGLLAAFFKKQREMGKK